MRAKGAALRLEALASEVGDRGTDMAAHEMLEISHRLAGAAGTFGFHAAGAHAAHVEQEAGRLCRGERVGTDQLREATRSLRLELDAAAASVPESGEARH